MRSCPVGDSLYQLMDNVSLSVRRIRRADPDGFTGLVGLIYLCHGLVLGGGERMTEYVSFFFVWLSW